MAVIRLHECTRKGLILFVENVSQLSATTAWNSACLLIFTSSVFTRKLNGKKFRTPFRARKTTGRQSAIKVVCLVVWFLIAYGNVVSQRPLHLSGYRIKLRPGRSYAMISALPRNINPHVPRSFCGFPPRDRIIRWAMVRFLIPAARAGHGDVLPYLFHKSIRVYPGNWLTSFDGTAGK